MQRLETSRQRRDRHPLQNALLRAAPIAVLFPVGAVGGGACATAPSTWVDDLNELQMAISVYTIRPGDRIRVLVWRQEELSGEMLVRADGKVTLPLAGDLTVAGLRTDEAAARAARRLDGLVVEPKVTVQVVEARLATYSVVGEVMSVGTYALNAGDGVLNAIAAAGGLNDFADSDQVYVLRQTPKPLRVRFSYKQLIDGVGQGLAFALRDGDIVVVR